MNKHCLQNTWERFERTRFHTINHLSARSVSTWDSQAVSRLWWNGDFGKLSYSRAAKRPSKYMWLKCSRIGKEDVIQYSLAPSSVYPGLLQTLQQRISHFPNFSVSQVLNRPNMCYIFEKQWIQGYQIWHSRVSNVKYTNTQIQSA